MSKNKVLGKVLSQVGIFVVSAFLAGILLLAIQANKLPGVIPKKEDFQIEDEVTPVIDNSLYNEIEVPIESKLDTSFNTASAELNQKAESAIIQAPAINPSSQEKKAEAKKEKKKQPQYGKQSTSVKPEQADYHYPTAKLDNKEKLVVSTSFGVSPLFFAGQSFIADYFPNSRLTFAPYCTIGLTFPKKNNFTCSLYFSVTSSLLNLNTPDIYNNINLDFSTTLVLSKIDFSIQYPVFSEKNLFGAHIGTGLTLFGKPVCTVNDLAFNRKNATYFMLDFGITFKHFFSNRFFVSAVLDISYILPASDKLILVQPAITAGLNL